MTYAVEMVDITKRFPGVLANDAVTLRVESGEVHALVGENGAGKSTLMNILYGVHQPDSGRILIDEREVAFQSPRDAIASGLGMVHQHFMLVPSYTVAENIVLGLEPRRRVLFDRHKAERITEELSTQYHLEVDPKAVIYDLPVGTQQRVEILKVLYRGADTIILDEPTAVLTPQETEELFNIIRMLVANGKTIIFITHKLYEVKSISDRVTVLRKGRRIDTVPTADVTEQDLARMMVGEDMPSPMERPPCKPGKTALALDNLTVKGALGVTSVRGVSFDVREGEIVTLAGVEGNGQSELVEAVTGMRPAAAGQVYVKEVNVVRKGPDAVRKQGVSHVPEDRIATGTNLDASVAENLIARRHNKPPLASWGWISKRKIDTFSSELVERYDIKTPSIHTLARTLSGGNLQKVVVARELSFDSTVLIVVQPTRGIDIASSRYIRDVLVEMRNNGRAILLVSTDLDEVFSISDRILVMYQGDIAGEFKPDEVTREELGLYMIGARRQKTMPDSREVSQ
jgi:ABC-type uncharacterized transport system ATPase subunit